MRRVVGCCAAAALMMAAAAAAAAGQTFGLAADGVTDGRELSVAAGQTFGLAADGVTDGRELSVATAGVPNSFSAGAGGLQEVYCFSLGWNWAQDCGENWLIIWDVYQCAYDDDYDGTWDRYGPVEMTETSWCWLNPGFF